MRLLVDARTGWGHGIGRVIANTVPRVARLRPDWRIDALVPPDRAGEAEAAFGGAPNLAIVPCPVRPFSAGEQLALARHARGHDLTWFTNYWVPLAWREPFVATVHDLLHLLPEFTPASPLKRRLSRLTFGKVRRDARAVMFDSRFTRREFERLVGPPRHRAATVALGGDHLHFPPPEPIGARARRLVVVAASKPHKNFALLFEAWRAADVPRHWSLTVVTPGEGLLTSIDLGALAGGGDRVEIRRGIDNDELARLYATSAVVLMPSLYEGFGLPLIEGLLAGALCVSSSAGSLVEVAGGAFVLWVNGADGPGWSAAIEQACALVDRGEPDLASVQRHNIDRARRFRWDRTAEEVARTLDTAHLPRQ